MYYNTFLSGYGDKILYSFIGLLVYIKSVYFNNKYKLELFDKIFIPMVYIVCANIVLHLSKLFIYELYAYFKNIIITEKDIYNYFNSVILCLLIDLFLLIIKISLGLLLILGLYWVFNWISKRYWIYISPYIMTEF